MPYPRGERFNIGNRCGGGAHIEYHGTRIGLFAGDRSHNGPEPAESMSREPLAIESVLLSGLRLEGPGDEILALKGKEQELGKLLLKQLLGGKRPAPCNTFVFFE